jgi:hypothetical protein
VNNYGIFIDALYRKRKKSRKNSWQEEEEEEDIRTNTQTKE